MIRICCISYLLLLAAACNTKPVKPLALLTPFAASVSDSMYNGVRPAVQRFTVNNNAAQTLKAAGGTTVLFPAQCFLNAAGEVVEGNVQVELVEAQSLKDFISGELATVSDGKLLVSNGMMYINATANGQQLQVDTANPLTVSMPTITSPAGFNMFTGTGTNWQPDSSMTEDPGYEITLPLNVLYPMGYKSLWYCITTLPDGRERYHCLDTTVLNIMNKKYENTCIATLGFENRYFRLLGMTQWMSYIRRGIEAIKESDCDNNDFDLSLYKEYLDHPNRSFKESDSAVKVIYLNYFKANQAKLADFCESVNKELRQYYSNWTDTNYHFDFRKRTLQQQYMELVEYFPSSKTREIKHFDTRGIDLNDPNAFNLLRQKGVAVKETNEMLRYNFLRNQLIRQLQSQNEMDKSKQQLEQMYRETVFAVDKMGWINCDRFYDDPNAGKADILVKGSSAENLKYINCSLVIPSLNVRLGAWPTDNGSYTFTQKDGRYIKLPVGMQAVIVGTTLQNNQLYFAAQKITIKDGITVNLPMKPIARASLADSLQAVVRR